jgi:2-methylisocitrate lyase-like PEP mutase family enzyme
LPDKSYRRLPQVQWRLKFHRTLATSSGASAGTLGRLDGKVTREEALAHARVSVAATDLPVSADLEKGFGDAPAEVAETIRFAAAAGLVGGSIEDATGNSDNPIYDIGQATKRVAAVRAVCAAVMTGLNNAAREVKERGTFNYLNDGLTSAQFAEFMQK